MIKQVFSKENPLISLPDGHLIETVRSEATRWVVDAKDVGRISKAPKLQLMIKVNHIVDQNQKVGDRDDQLGAVNRPNVEALHVQVADVETVEKDRGQQEEGIGVVQHKAGKEHKLLDAIVVVVVAEDAQPLVVDVLEVAPNRQRYQPDDQMTVHGQVVRTEQRWLIALTEGETVLLDGKDKAEDPVYDLKGKYLRN